GLPAETIFEGDTDSEVLLAFTRGGWENPDAAEERGTIQYVEYVRAEDRLLRRVRQRIDAAPDTPVIDRPLFTGVADARIEFILGELVEETWEAPLTGSAQESLPAIIALEVELERLGRIRQLFLTPRM
ncbi:MAG: type II secretion system protein GspJ, partial [Caulobacterales bacterium]|nr:type II secretion system protein GspJ [Caulobacterales bacterium]